MFLDVIDVGSGNINSVGNWIDTSGFTARRVEFPRDLKSNIIVLPGVGSTHYFLKALRKKQFDKAITDHIEGGGKVIGICVGFQVLADQCHEGDISQGLGVIPGTVQKIPTVHSHNQWQPFQFRKDDIPDQYLFSSGSQYRKRAINGRVFFNHEYGFIVEANDVFTIPIDNKLRTYSAFAIKGNVVGMQFHPEKSQSTGSEILKMLL